MKDKVICIMCEDKLDVNSAKFDGWLISPKLTFGKTFQAALCYSCKIRSI